MFLLLAATDDKLTDAVTLMIVGMAVVFGSLAILLGVVVLINRLLHQTTPAPAPAPGSSSPAPGSSKPAPAPGHSTRGSVAGEDGRLVAVLAAAATAALGRPVRVTDVQSAESSVDRL